MQKILVTGANGLLGRDLCPILKRRHYEIITTDIDDLDITNFDSCLNIINKENPQIVIHCAAYTDVEKAEQDFEIAQKINILGTQNIAKICSQKDIVLIHISTDYVFDGKKNTPYTVKDIPNPINNYGLTKYRGEEIIKKYCNKYYIIRTSWLYGKNGKDFVNTMLNLAQKNETIRVVNDQIGSPTWTVELSNKIIETFNEHPYGIYHISGEGETSWYNFAKEIFKLKKVEVNLSSCTSFEFKQKALRPSYSVLKNSIKCCSWQESLKNFLESD